MNISFKLVFFLSLSLLASCQASGAEMKLDRNSPTAQLTSTAVATPASITLPIKVYFRNNKGRFVNLSLVVYPPGATRATVISKFLLPWQRFSVSYPPGTKCYLASNQQLRLIQGGKDLRDDSPAMTLRESDANQEYKLYP